MVYAEIAYHEGGLGWWPIECLEESASTNTPSLP